MMIKRMLKNTVIIFSLINALLLAGCATVTPQKAPCDALGTGCGAKIRINPC